MFKLDLEKTEEPEIKLPISIGLQKNQENSRKNIFFCFIDYAKVFDCVDHNKLWKILKKIGIPDHMTFFLKNLYAGQEATIKTGHGATDCIQTGKGILQDVQSYPVYLTPIQSTSYKMPGWMKHKLESRLTGKASIASDMQMTPPLQQKVKR